MKKRKESEINWYTRNRSEGVLHVQRKYLVNGKRKIRKLVRFAFCVYRELVNDACSGSECERWRDFWFVVVVSFSWLRFIFHSFKCRFTDTLLKNQEHTMSSYLHHILKYIFTYVHTHISHTSNWFDWIEPTIKWLNLTPIWATITTTNTTTKTLWFEDSCLNKSIVFQYSWIETSLIELIWYCWI